MPTGIGGGGGGSDTGSVSFGPISLTAGTPKTVIRLAAVSNRRVKILGYGFFFDGVDVLTSAVEIQVGRISADGTFTGAAPDPDDQDSPTSFATSVGINATAEPTYSNYLKTFTVHPKFSNEYLAPMGHEIWIKGGGMLGFVCNAPAAVDVRGYVMFSEAG